MIAVCALVQIATLDNRQFAHCSSLEALRTFNRHQGRKHHMSQTNGARKANGSVHDCFSARLSFDPRYVYVANHPNPNHGSTRHKKTVSRFNRALVAQSGVYLPTWLYAHRMKSKQEEAAVTCAGNMRQPETRTVG